MAISTKPGASVLIVHWAETEPHGEFTDTGTLVGIHHGATTTTHRGILVEPLKVMRLTKRGDFSGLISDIYPDKITNYRATVIGAGNLVMEE